MKEITLEAVEGNIAAVTAFVDEALEAAGCPPKAQMQLDVAIDEVFCNIARYAYAPGTGSATVRLEMTEEPRTAVLTFIDRGAAFDPLSAPEPETTQDLEHRPVGGLGIFLVRRLMDDVRYERRDGQNVLCVRKRIGPPSPLNRP